MPIDCNRCGGSVAVDEDDREAGYVQCENCRTVLDLTTGRGSAGGSESSRSDAVVDWQAGSTGAASTGREVGADSSTSQRSDRSVEGWERADGGSTGTAADAGGASVESTPSGDPFPEADPLEDLSQLDVELPGGVTLVDDADGLHLVRHWNRLYSVAGALVTAFGLFWTSTGDIIQPSADLMDLAMLAAGLLTVAGAGYWTLCQLLNDTHVRIGPSNSGLELTVEHGPLYWPGRHRISA
ncbi:MAG: hypothetical protein ABEL76_04400, partial [Bradymonadaceae bacterium]